jgi:diguanylate cyclase (GGDEF)-like protein
MLIKTELSAVQADAEAPESLPNALVQNEQAKILVDESAERLSSINAGIRQDLLNQNSPPNIEDTLDASEAVEVKVLDASEKLSVVNLALKDEIDNRHALEDELATVTEQARADIDAALHDPLTGLPNRALFYDRLQHAFQHAIRHGGYLALLFMDLDDFKIINDTCGHDAGDSVLQMVADRLRESIRGGDTASRYGGDEFIVLITEVREDTNISLIAEKIIKKIGEPFLIGARDLNLNRSIAASIGISIFPKDGADAETLVKSADTAMYEAKRNKSNYFFAQQSRPERC